MSQRLVDLTAKPQTADGGQSNGTFTGTEAQLPDGEEITAGDHIWDVVAFTRDGTNVGTKERFSRFTVRLSGK